MAANARSYGPKESHPRWKGGRRIHAEGYVQISGGEYRGKLEHRRVMEQMLESPVGLCFPGDGKIPRSMTVHHCDHTRHHNCQGNLMLLDKRIHDAISNMRRAWLDANEVPEWVEAGRVVWAK